MKYFLLILIPCLLQASSNFCNYHWTEIRQVRMVAEEYIVQSHQIGGKFYNTSCFNTADDCAYSDLKNLKTYSEFGALFQALKNHCCSSGLPLLYEGYEKVGERFLELYNRCIQEHQNLHSQYERGKIYFDLGQYDLCLSDIECLLDSEQQDIIPENQISVIKGQSFVETYRYDEAIKVLSSLISNYPEEKQAYLQRAYAYFETGLFDLSFQDFIDSEISQQKEKTRLAPKEFIEGFIPSIIDGVRDGLQDFFPSLCYTTYGLGKALWAFGEQPVNSIQLLGSASYEMVDTVVDYLKTVDRETLEDYAQELIDLYENFSEISDLEKGKIMGYTIGKYGTEIFAGSALLKGVTTYKALKNANRLCNLESMAISASSKQKVKAQAAKQFWSRSNFFKDVKIEWGKQNKHVPSSSFFQREREVSIWEHPDPQGLLKKFAGKGQPKKGIPGQPGFKETIDFGERVGIWKSLDGLQGFPTTRGTIHYSKKGAHIVPAYPKK